MNKSLRTLVVVALMALLAACSNAADDTTTTAADTGGDTTTADTSADTTATSAPASTVADSTAPEETTTTTTSGGEAPSSGDLEVLRRAMENSAQNQPSRIEGVMTIQLPEGAGTAEMPMSMLLDPESGNTAMTMDMAAMAAAGGEEVPPELAAMMGEMEVRQIGDTVYMRFPFFTAFLGAGTEWVSMPAEEGEDVAGDLASGAGPSDPTSFLENLSDVEGNVEVLGTEDVRGISTTHYRLIVDESWQDQLSDEELEELEEQGPLPDDSFPMELWISDDGLVHKMMITIENIEGEEDFDGMSMTFDFFDFGQPQTIEPPPADQVTDMSELEAPLGTVEP